MFISDTIRYRYYAMGRGAVRLSLAAFLFAVICQAGTAAAAPVLPLHTSGQFIVDSNGSHVRLSAFNWYGADSSDYVVAGLQAQPLQTIVTEIKNLGFNAVRLPWSNQLVESNPVVANYALTANATMQGENALAILDQVISALTNAGIMVILDNHNSNAEWCCSTTDGNSLWYNSQYPQANWIADWQTMAQRYQNNHWVIGADLRNEPRSPATWGGSAANDWHAAAQLGGNAVLAVNPNLLIFVEGVNYAGDLSGVTSLPVQLNVANQLVYEAHDYGFWYSGLNGYSSWLNAITPKWGFLVTGSNPQPFWIGEFGTCDTADTCVSSNSASDGGYWFNMITSYMQDYGVNWSYWAINGTQSTGSSRTYGAAESYGILNSSWSGTASAPLAARLGSMMPSASANFSLIPPGAALTVTRGAGQSATLTVIPENGFTGTINLNCTVSQQSGGNDTPTCSVPASVSVTGTNTTTATVTVATTAASASISPARDPKGTHSRAPVAAILACALVFVGNLARRRSRWLLATMAIAAALSLAGLSGCGGSKAGAAGTSNPGTSAGTYTVTVSGSATGLSNVTTQILVTVQ